MRQLLSVWKEGSVLITACLLPGFALEKQNKGLLTLLRERHTKKRSIVPSLVGDC